MNDTENAYHFMKFACQQQIEEMKMWEKFANVQVCCSRQQGAHFLLKNEKLVIRNFWLMQLMLSSCTRNYWYSCLYYQLLWQSNFGYRLMNGKRKLDIITVTLINILFWIWLWETGLKCKTRDCQINTLLKTTQDFFLRNMCRHTILICCLFNAAKISLNMNE